MDVSAFARGAAFGAIGLVVGCTGSTPGPVVDEGDVEVAARPVNVPAQPVVLPPSNVPGAWSRIVQTDGNWPPWASHAFAGQVELPASEAAEFLRSGAATVVISPEAIGMEGEELVRLVEGRVPTSEVKESELPRVRAALEKRREDGDLPYNLVVFADRRVRSEVLAGVLRTTTRAGISHVQLAVRRPSDPPYATVAGLSVLARSFGPDINGADLGDGEDPHEFALAVMVSAEAVELGKLRHTGEVEKELHVREADGWKRLSQWGITVAMQLEPTNASPVVVFGARPEVTVQRMISAVASVSGPECTPEVQMEWPRHPCWSDYRVFVADAETLWGLSPRKP